VLVLLALGALLHFVRLSEPRRVVFDEVHFGGFVSAYLGDHRYFFDVHPPHAKLLIAAVSGLGGYRGGQDFASLDAPYEAVSPALLRAAPALAGTLLPAVLFGLLLQLGARPMAAFLGGLCAVLDNALLVQTRIIALDGFLLLGIFGSLSALLAALAARSARSRVAWTIGAGALAGLAAGTKFTGLAVLPLLAVCIWLPVLRSGARAPSLRAAFGTSTWLLVTAATVYAAGWALHFALLDQPGPGDAWAVPTGSWVRDTLEVHRHMLRSNFGLEATHPYASPWWSWPFMARPIYYWTHGDAALYFVGNPVVWWGAALGLVLLAGTSALRRVTGLSVPEGVARPVRLWLPLLGYAVALAPLVRVPRALFLYHYLTALLFSLCAVMLWLDHLGFTRDGGWRAQRASFHGGVVALGVGFLVISPFSFAFVTAPTLREWVFALFPGWR